MRTLVWFRQFLLLSRQRYQLWRAIPLWKKPWSTIPHRIALTALPVCLVVRAATQIDDSKESNRSKDLAPIVEQLDSLFAKADYEKGYEYVEKNRTNPSFQSHYIRWRVARALYKYSETVKDKQLKKKLVEDAYEQAKLALNEGNHISAVHKWYGIILNERSQYISTEEQIRSAFEVLDHFEEAVRLNPQDPNTYYLLGAWYWEVSQISGWKRRLSKMIYGELPKATVHDALKKFLLAEEISPNFDSKNLLMIVKCYTELNARTAAMEFAKLLLDRERKTPADEENYQELLKLIPRIEKLLPFPGQV